MKNNRTNSAQPRLPLNKLKNATVKAPLCVLARLEPCKWTRSRPVLSLWTLHSESKACHAEESLKFLDLRPVEKPPWHNTLLQRCKNREASQRLSMQNTHSILTMPKKSVSTSII